MRVIAMMLCAAAASSADVSALQAMHPTGDSTPISTRPDAIATVTEIARQGGEVAGHAISVTGPLVTPDAMKKRMHHDYYARFADAVKKLPAVIMADAPIQQAHAEKALYAMGIDPRFVQAAIQEVDQQAGVLIDILAQPECILFGFDAYRENPDRFK